MTFTLLARRVSAAIIGAGGVLAAVAAPAVAYDGPGCTAADIMAVEAQMTTAMAGYLFTRPDVNGFLTSTNGMPNAQRRSMLADYLAANPQVGAEIDAIKNPGVALRNRCSIPASHLHLGLL
ncbi:MAG: heme-binding protein [Mycobacterium sp.]